MNLPPTTVSKRFILPGVMWVSTTVVPDLTIYTRPVHILMDNPFFEQDSLALVAIYNAMDGPNWYYNENWLTGPVSTWSGVHVQKWQGSRILHGRWQ